MAILGAASSAVIQAFETCGLSPMSAHGGDRSFDTWKGRAAWLTSSGGSYIDSEAAPPQMMQRDCSRGSEASRNKNFLLCLDDDEALSARAIKDRNGNDRSPAAAYGKPQQQQQNAPYQSPAARNSPAARSGCGQACEWESDLPPPPPPPPPPRINAAKSAPNLPVNDEKARRRAAQVQRVEELVEELFRMHDLNQNGVLEEVELIKLNEKIAMLHYGSDTDKNAIKEKFSNLFRAELDKDGRPVPYQKFRGYMLKLLDGIDRSKAAQELILEQFVEEAKSGRLAFHCHSFQSITDEPFRKMIEQFPGLK